MASTPHVYTASHANETHANAVSIDLIEQAKENVQPLRRGRDPHALIKVLQQNNGANRNANNTATDATSCTPAAAPVACGTAVSRAESELKAERKVLESAIKSYPADGPSPLAPWLAYLSWTRQNFLSGSTEKSHMLPLLEKCTRSFLRDARVNQSIEYLKIWIEYAEHVDDAIDMFVFMDANGVARLLAQFYEAWSLTLERRGRNQAALDTLDMGAGRGAAPAWRIKDAKSRMQARIAKAIAAEVAASIEAGVAVGAAAAPQTNEQRVTALAQQIADENGTLVRQPLQRIGNLATREPMAERAVNGQTIYAAPAPAAVSGVIVGAPRSAAARRTNGIGAPSSNASNFQVFDESVSSAASASASSSSAAPPPLAVWNEFASVASSSKENRDRSSSWAEPLHAPVTGAGALAEGSVVSLPPPAIHSDFPVFVDPECAVATMRADASKALEDAAAAAGSNPRKRLDPTALRATSDKAGHVALAKLTSQPLRNMNKTTAAATSSSSSSSSATPAAASSSSTAGAAPAAARVSSSSSSSSRSASSSSASGATK